MQDAELPSLLEITGEEATPVPPVTGLGSAPVRLCDSDPFLLYSRKDLAEQTSSGPKGEVSSYS